MTLQEELQLQDEFPGIDTEFIKYQLKFKSFKQVCHKLSQSKVYPLKLSDGKSVLDKRNDTLLQILEIQGYKCINLELIQEIKSLILSGKSIYEILEILKDATSKEMCVSISQSILFQNEEYYKESEKLLLQEFSQEFWTFKILEILDKENSFIIARKKLLQRQRDFLENLYFKTRKVFSIFHKSQQENSLQILEHSLCSLQSDQLKKEILQEISKKDEKLATLLNKNQYSSLKEEIQCGCCFQGKSWEELGSCKGGHLFCNDCILSLVRECIYGTGIIRGNTIKCVDINGHCQEEILDLERFVPKKLMVKYNSLITLKAVEMAGVKLSKCPFCSYAEENDLSYNLLGKWKRWISNLITYDRVKKVIPLAAFLISFFLATCFQGSSKNLYFSVFLSVYVKRRLDLVDLRRILQKIQALLKEKNVIFNCKQCLKASCINCLGEWEVDHECHEKEKSSFRLFVEKRMSEALLRTCPKCRISFSKADGCNKITCPECKYSMCFICRADIRKEKYSHFCNHFRIIPGPCTECNKCDLYIAPDDDKVVNKAAKDARVEWMSSHPEWSMETMDFSLDNIG